MKSNPVVSIIMPSFNSALFIEYSLKSVLQQEFKEWELLVVDGGSFDNTREIVERYSKMDRRIKLLINVDDKGPAHARSTGIRQALGDFVSFLDGDDIWLRNKLSSQIDFMLKTGAVFSYTQYRVMNSEGSKVSCPLAVSRKYNYPSYLYRRGIACSTVVVRRELFTDKILQSYGSWLAEDTHWWLMLLRDGATAHALLQPLVLYRDSEGSLSKHRIRNQTSVWQLYRNEFQLTFVTSMFSYLSYVIDVAWRRSRYRICTKFFGTKSVEEILI
jgi:teichuronic acid biosynthesis glycosyltransferase TuaG